MTLPELARGLGVETPTLRHFLARTFPDSRPGKGKQWSLTEEMARDAWWFYRGRWIGWKA